MNDQSWLLVLVLCCAIPFVLVVVLSLWVIRRGQSLITPEHDDLQRDFDRLRASNPTLTTEQLVNKIIQRQAFRAGLVGALTSLGGVFTLPLGLIIDLYTTSRIQNATLFFIAQAFGAEGRVPLMNFNQALALRAEDRVREFVAAQGTMLGQRITRRLIVILVEKTFAKLIPGIGLVIGFVVNYAIARGISQLAAGYYSGTLLNSGGKVGELAAQVAEKGDAS